MTTGLSLKMKHRLQKVVLSGVTIVVMLMCGEIFVRCLVYVPRGTPYVALNPDTIYYNKPGITGRHISPGEFDYEFNTNDQGFRGRKRITDSADVPRILCLGDSFTFGVGVADSETWPVRLEARLESDGVKTEAINAGVMGWGLAEYWIWARMHAAKYHPRLIVVGCHASDWENAFNGLVTLGLDGNLQTHPVVRQDISVLKGVTTKIPFYNFISTHSALAALVKESVIQFTRTGTVGGMAGGPPEDTARAVEQSAAVNKALLRGLNKVADEAGAKLLVVFIPSHDELVWDMNEDHNYRRFRTIMQTWTTELDIPFFDVTPLLRSHVERFKLPMSALYYPMNMHCTAAGYDLIASGIEEAINSHSDWLESFPKASSPQPSSDFDR